VDTNLLAQEKFLCTHYEGCAASCRPKDQFRAGTMSHVGRHFDLFRDGKPLRIVIVGQESGLPKDSKLAAGVSLDARYRQIHDDSGLHRRYNSDGSHSGRNPHMRGTTSALRIIFGTGLGKDHEGEVICPTNADPFHIFDGFALVNRLLCSAGPANSSRGRPTKTMFRNCSEHFAATLKILEPTILILQGRAVAKQVEAVLARDRVYNDFLYEAYVDNRRVLVCSFSHPSAHGKLRWGDSLNAEYLTNFVVPTLEAALLEC
jgi:hypothetical protein